MIRIMLGLFIIFAAVGTDDYAMETSTTPPELWKTMLMASIGMMFMGWGALSVNKDEEDA